MLGRVTDQTCETERTDRTRPPRGGADGAERTDGTAHAVPRSWRIAAGAGLSVYAVALALVVLLPESDHAALGAVERFARWVAHAGLPFEAVFPVVEFTANVVLFVPFGVLFPLAVGRLRGGSVALAVLLGSVCSVGIEVAQLWIPGRVSDPRDVISNTLGAALGAIAVVVLGGRTVRRRHSVALQA